MHAASDIAEFLTRRRGRVTPEQVGLPTLGPRRVIDLLASWAAIPRTDSMPAEAFAAPADD